MHWSRNQFGMGPMVLCKGALRSRKLRLAIVSALFALYLFLITKVLDEVLIFIF